MKFNLLNLVFNLTQPDFKLHFQMYHSLPSFTHSLPLTIWIVWHSVVYPTCTLVLATLNSLLQATKTEFGYGRVFSEAKGQGMEKTGIRAVEVWGAQ